MLPTDWLSWLNDRPRPRPSDRRPRTRRNRVRQSHLCDWLLEERLLLAGVQMPCDTVPSSKGVSGVLYDGGLVTPTPATQPYVKHITITNNSTETIYPFLEDANNRTAVPGDPFPATTYTGTGMFDPFDPLNHEYRGYIGYT